MQRDATFNVFIYLRVFTQLIHVYLVLVIHSYMNVASDHAV